jgi:hypothetical protein
VCEKATLLSTRLEGEVARQLPAPAAGLQQRVLRGGTTGVAVLREELLQRGGGFGWRHAPRRERHLDARRAPLGDAPLVARQRLGQRQVVQQAQLQQARHRKRNLFGEEWLASAQRKP